MKDYVAQLRALLGHRPLILPGSSVVVSDEQGKVLLLARADTGGWGLPGGLMDPGESFEDTARREVLEETGLVVGALTLLGLFSGGPTYFYRYPNGDQVHNATAAYVTALPAGAVVVPDQVENTAAAFFDIDRLPADVIPPERPILDAYRDTYRHRQDGSTAQAAGQR
ncbi:DNA mismatch repair protein MutT [Streptomyces dioscori]|uniref:DNA mismatch repair protein MutT n=1 Tax=Streptomyces dioscori TaxID=2109333 RepID=A0A2P8QEE9_9ACTN|nr:NUDIX hydrolase [Streptomyces dioscori]PSM44617.1 DNA mismatch repair protein MutT [Streptomyces dioscori]